MLRRILIIVEFQRILEKGLKKRQKKVSLVILMIKILRLGRKQKTRPQKKFYKSQKIYLKNQVLLENII